jgi:class 3 adenylate cyclase
MSQTNRRLAAILAADVAGYSRLMGADEEGTHERLKAHLRELIEPKVAEHRGRIVKNTGDGFLAEFPSVVDAVRCAVEVQRGMADREPELPEERRMRFRIGVNLGDVIVEEDDIFGDGVNVAARLEGLAEPGGICVSRMVRDNVRDKLDFAFEDMGEQSVKNIARPVRVYALRLGAGLAAPVAPVLKLTTASSLPEEFALQYIIGTHVKVYTVDAKFLQNGIPIYKPVSVGYGSARTERVSTTFSYIFELQDRSHYTLYLTEFPLQLAIGVMVTFLCFEDPNRKKILFSIYNHSDPRWLEIPFSRDGLCTNVRPT